MNAACRARPGGSIAVALAHRDPVVRAGLQATLALQRDFEVSELAPEAVALRPGADVVIADYDTALRLFSGPEAGRHAPARVMVLSHRDRETEIRNALDLGVRGYLLLGCGLDEMVVGVRALHRGQHHLDSAAARRVAESLHHPALTTRENDVLRLIARGLANKSIASELGITVGTVKAHVKAVLAKFGARTRTEAAAIAQRRGLYGGG